MAENEGDDSGAPREAIASITLLIQRDLEILSLASQVQENETVVSAQQLHALAKGLSPLQL